MPKIKKVSVYWNDTDEVTVFEDYESIEITGPTSFHAVKDKNNWEDIILEASTFDYWVLER